MESRTEFWDFSAFSEPSAPAPAFTSFKAGPSVEIMRDGGNGSQLVGPHLTSLKLGKRHYFEDGGRSTAAVGKRSGKGFSNGFSSSSSSSSSSLSPLLLGSVPRCQVEGCNLTLVDAKDYHRRHKVCEKHSKAPTVVVLGMEQRFCQQCSRFHVVSEFDDAKRSCRRRLAGHNERRRKSSSEASGKNPSQENKTLGGKFACISSSSTGRALSLLSPSKSVSSSSWGDLSSVSSAALRELIAEKRATFHSMQLSSQCTRWPHAADGVGKGQAFIPYGHIPEAAEWNQFH